MLPFIIASVALILTVKAKADQKLPNNFTNSDRGALPALLGRNLGSRFSLAAAEGQFTDADVRPANIILSFHAAEYRL